MAGWRYEISLLVLKKYFSTLEEQFRISARPCNILGTRLPLCILIIAHNYVNVTTINLSMSLLCFRGKSDGTALTAREFLNRGDS